MQMDRPGIRVGIVVAMLLVLGACTSNGALVPKAAPPVASSASEWLDDVRAISRGAGNTHRREAIRELLAGAGIETREAAFTAGSHAGTNLLADVSGDPSLPLLLLGAHFDKVDVGDGVTDNASGSAAVIALARRFQQRPLRHHRVAAAFWDLEEKGLLGANAYVTGSGEKPALYVNFDIFGWGDTLWMMVQEPAHPLASAADAAAQAHGIGLSAGEKYPPTDHLAFQKAGWPAVSFSLLDAGEIEPVLQVFSRGKPARMPKVMEVIHSPNDRLDQVDAIAVERGIDAVEAAIRAWDAGQP